MKHGLDYSNRKDSFLKFNWKLFQNRDLLEVLPWTYLFLQTPGDYQLINGN